MPLSDDEPVIGSLGGTSGDTEARAAKAATILEKGLREVFFDFEPHLSDNEPVFASLGGTSGGTGARASRAPATAEVESDMNFRKI